MRLLPILFLLLLAPSLPGQATAGLRAKRDRLLDELRRTNAELSATRARRGAAVDQAELLRTRVTQRRELVATLGEEIAHNRRRMRRDSGVIVALNDDLERARAEYGVALRAANRARLSAGWLVFLLSAEGFNDAFRRLNYLRQYRRYRSRQGALIRQTRTTLSDRYERLTFQRYAQDSLLDEARRQGATLEEELADQTRLVERLSASERRLLERARRQRRRSEELGRSVAAAIAESQRRDREQRKKRSSGSLASEADGATSAVGRDIGRRRGRLGWPVRGTVSRPFGEQPHPEVPSVRIRNSGIDIRAGAGSAVEAVFSGRVIAVREVPGFRSTVMLRHGEYYTVYSNLETTRVSRGDEVRAGQPLGRTAAAGQDFHFELWRGKQPLDPERWLVK